MIDIRKETVEDIPAIRVINERAFKQAAEANVVDKLREICPGFLSLVAVLEGQVVGISFLPPPPLKATVFRSREWAWLPWRSCRSFRTGASVLS
jgi:predicted N-acetyltransferase YhbS